MYYINYNNLAVRKFNTSDIYTYYRLKVFFKYWIL